MGRLFPLLVDKIFSTIFPFFFFSKTRVLLSCRITFCFPSLDAGALTPTHKRHASRLGDECTSKHVIPFGAAFLPPAAYRINSAGTVSQPPRKRYVNHAQIAAVVSGVPTVRTRGCAALTQANPACLIPCRFVRTNSSVSTSKRVEW